MSAGRLVVCPTPIGNFEDITLRVLSALREADVVACEDTRRTGMLLDRYGVKAKLVSYHEHNEAARASALVGQMREGAVVALVSDAGMPLVSDPGYVLVRACVAAGLPVEVLPGPSAAITALVASGMPADEWHFHGFLPRKKGELREVLSHGDGTLVAFESPRRLPATLQLLAELDGEREVAVCRELTKTHEEVVRGTAAELAARYAAEPPKGEIVLVLAPLGQSGIGRGGSGGGRCAAAARRGRGAPAQGRDSGGRSDRRQRKRAVPGADFRVTNRNNPATAPRPPRACARTLAGCADSSSPSPPFCSSPLPHRLRGAGPSEATSSLRTATGRTPTRADSTEAST